MKLFSETLSYLWILLLLRDEQTALQLSSQNCSKIALNSALIGLTCHWSVYGQFMITVIIHPLSGWERSLFRHTKLLFFFSIGLFANSSRTVPFTQAILPFDLMNHNLNNSFPRSECYWWKWKSKCFILKIEFKTHNNYHGTQQARAICSVTQSGNQCAL